MKILKHKFLKSFFAFLSVVVVLVSFSVNIFAADQPAFFSSGYSHNDNTIYSGNNGISISLGVIAPDSEDFNVSTSLNPSFSYDMALSNTGNYSGEYVEPDGLNDTIQVDLVFNNFEFSDNYFVSDMVSANSFFASSFDLGYSLFLGMSDCYVDFVKVSARDFYIYLDPNGDFGYPNYDDFIAESFLYLDTKSYYDYDQAEGTIYYCLAGEEDSANNRQVYNYGLPADAGNYSQLFPLPVDQSFSGTYSEPTLIYVEYFEFNIPLVSVQTINGMHVSGTYVNYNMDYRNIDISSYEDPISPINPGIFRDYTGWIGTAVGGFLDLTIVDGFSLGGVLMVLIAFMITMWFLKVFAGG